MSRRTGFHNVGRRRYGPCPEQRNTKTRRLSAPVEEAVPKVGHSCPTWTDKKVRPTAQLILRVHLVQAHPVGQSASGGSSLASLAED